MLFAKNVLLSAGSKQTLPRIPALQVYAQSKTLCRVSLGGSISLLLSGSALKRPEQKGATAVYFSKAFWWKIGNLVCCVRVASWPLRFPV